MAAGDVTVSKYPSDGSPFASGVVVCDADTAINVQVGFQPSMIKLYYKDAGDTLNAVLTWFTGMTAGYYFKDVGGTMTLETSGGPIVYAGGMTITEATGAKTYYNEGFTIPAGLMDNDADSIYFEVHL